MYNVCILCSGAGSRFSSAGYKLPKPLIKYNAKPLFAYAVDSVLKSFGGQPDIWFTVLRSHIEEFSIEDEITTYLPGAKFITIDKITNGAAETAYIAAQKIGSNKPVIFVDCDVSFATHNIMDINDEFMNTDALIFTFKSQSPAYSYCKIDNGKLITAEKRVISNDAICGVYGFRTSQYFINLYRVYKSNCEDKELYLSGVLNGITDKCNILALDFVKNLGTPADIDD